ncbi:MAG: branched-chain amino acid ABC transporter permease [Chloroflexi bacterium]|nr:branched-chain amino acid ABC transporter permease [Chloroflexota bacterium]
MKKSDPDIQVARPAVSVALTTLVQQPMVKVGVSAVLLAVAVLVPFILTGYWVRVLTTMLMYAALASSLNIIMGYTGYTDFGNIVFFGIGAYSTGILMKVVGLPLLLAMPVGAVLCSLLAVVMGLPILRLRGYYFAIASLGLSQAMRELVRNMEITGGAKGFSFPMWRVPPRTFNISIYFLMFGLMLMSIAISRWVLHSRLGYGLRAIRADEQGAAVMGINTTWHKITAWALSAFMTGLVGGAYGFWFVYVTPDDVFNILVSVKYLVMVLLGGAGTVAGPVIGAFVLEYVSDFIWARFSVIHMGVLGLAIILTVLFMPRGFLHMIRTRVRPLLARAIIRAERS